VKGRAYVGSDERSVDMGQFEMRGHREVLYRDHGCCAFPYVSVQLARLDSYVSLPVFVPLIMLALCSWKHKGIFILNLDVLIVAQTRRIIFLHPSAYFALNSL